MFEELGSPSFVNAGPILVASDAKATREMAFVRRNSSGNAEILCQREGSSGSSYSLREVKSGPVFRYLADGDTYAEFVASYKRLEKQEFSTTVEGSIADIVSRHALSALREYELTNGR